MMSSFASTRVGDRAKRARTDLRLNSMMVLMIPQLTTTVTCDQSRPPVNGIFLTLTNHAGISTEYAHRICPGPRKSFKAAKGVYTPVFNQSKRYQEDQAYAQALALLAADVCVVQHQSDRDVHD
eukprot:1194583-Prorocentrum_minimum.AAC.2